MTRLRFLAMAAPIVFVAATVPRPAVDRASGVTYSFVSRVQTTDPNGKSTERIGMSGHASILGDRARIDLDSLAAPMTPAQHQEGASAMQGMYFLSLDGGRKFVYVIPSKKQYMEMQTLGMMQGLNALTGAGGLIKFEASNIHVDAEKLGAGPTILGHRTVHYRLTDSKTMKTRILFKTMTSRDSTVTDLYYAPDLKNFINPFLSNSQATTGALDMFGAEYKQQYMAAHAKLYQEGAPLRTVATRTRTDGSGKVTTTISTMEVTQLNTGYVNPSIFDIPADYTKIDTSVPSGPSERSDSPAQNHADSATTVTKKDILKKGIRGLFGRPQ
jgi:hypothetical protein